MYLACAADTFFIVAGYWKYALFAVAESAAFCAMRPVVAFSQQYEVTFLLFNTKALLEYYNFSARINNIMIPNRDDGLYYHNILLIIAKYH